MTRITVGIWAACLLVLVIIGALLGPGLDQRFIPGVWLWNAHLGQLTPEKAQDLIQKTVALTEPRIVFVGPEGQRWAYAPADLGLSLELNATLDQAFRPGHQAMGLAAIPERLNIMRQGIAIAPVLLWDRAQAQKVLHSIAQEIDLPAHDALIELNGDAVVLHPGSAGRVVDVEATLTALEPSLRTRQPVEITLPMVVQEPAITDDEAAQARDLAQRILQAELVYFIEKPQAGDPGPWRIPPEVVAEHLVVKANEGAIRVEMEPQYLTEFLTPLQKALKSDPKDARFHFDPDTRQLVTITDSVNGRMLDVTGTISRTNEFLQQGITTIPLVVPEILPRYPSTITAKALGIVEEIGMGESYYYGSNYARDKNVRIGSAALDGIIIGPGETFSFNFYIGDVTPEKGYDESFVIIGDRTEPGVGGGLCQVATTLFRAAFYSGLEILERWPHAYRVGYYELGGYPVGMDATVYAPLVDFRFRNDTPYHLLIQREIDVNRQRLRFHFYSTSTGRRVEMKGPYKSEPVTPGPPVYQFDPEHMKEGEVKQVETAHDGMQVTVKRIVYDKNGKVIHENTFVSNYVPWPERYLYGPGFEPPPDVVIITPEPTPTPIGWVPTPTPTPTPEATPPPTP